MFEFKSCGKTDKVSFIISDLKFHIRNNLSRVKIFKKNCFLDQKNPGKNQKLFFQSIQTFSVINLKVCDVNQPPFARLKLRLKVLLLNYGLLANKKFLIKISSKRIFWLKFVLNLKEQNSLSSKKIVSNSLNLQKIMSHRLERKTDEQKKFVNTT